VPLEATPVLAQRNYFFAGRQKSLISRAGDQKGLAALEQMHVPANKSSFSSTGGPRASTQDQVTKHNPCPYTSANSILSRCWLVWDTAGGRERGGNT